jgi:hypothetical protein
MKKIKQATRLAFFFTIFTLKAFSQEFLDDRTMKLSEVSTDETYGYEIKNPIKVGPKEKADASYLNALKLPTGERMHIADMKFNVKGKTGVEMVTLSFEGLKETKTLYISTAAFENPKAPVGFQFKTLDDLPKVVKFSPDSIRKSTPCWSTIYAVEDFLLKEKVGELPKPDKAPEFIGGIEELKKYFAAHPLTDEKTKQMVFRVSISFLVTCDGHAGNFQIVTKGRGDLETYANQVLAIVNSMPQSWKAALKDGKGVDCYQVLSFSVVNGQLDKVTYR